MGGVPEQRHPPEGPWGDRIAIDHREHEGRRRGTDQRRHIEPVEHPVLELGQEVVEHAGAVPVLALSQLGPRSVELGDEVEGLAPLGQVCDRIADELLVAVTGPDHRATIQYGVELGDPAPEQ